MPNPTIVAKGDVVEVLLYGEIGWEADAKSFADEINAKATGGAKSIHLRINSPGGSVFDGVAMRSALVATGLPVRVTVDGIAASAATFFLTVAEHVAVNEGGAVMIHEARAFVGGSAGDMTRMAARLSQINDDMAAAYAERMGKDVSEVKTLMAAETWFTAQEAVDAGLADEVIKLPKKQRKEAAAAIAACAAQMKGAPAWLMRSGPEEDSTPTGPGPEGSTMTDIVLQSLGAKDEAQAVRNIHQLEARATESEARAEKLIAAIGANSAEEALGTIAAFKDISAKHEALSAEVAGIRAKAAEAERERLIEGAKAVGKLTNAMVDSGILAGLDNVGLAACIAKLPKILTMAGDALQQPRAEGEKSWVEMSAAEKTDLYASNPTAFYEARRVAGL